MALARAIPVLPVLDLERGASFFEQSLGFERVFLLPGNADGVERDQVTLHLWLTDDPALPKVSSCRIEVGSEDDLATVLAQAESAGIVHPNGQLADKPWGAREFTVLDPFGNAVTFVYWQK